MPPDAQAAEEVTVVFAFITKPDRDDVRDKVQIVWCHACFLSQGFIVRKRLCTLVKLGFISLVVCLYFLSSLSCDPYRMGCGAEAIVFRIRSLASLHNPPSTPGPIIPSPDLRPELPLLNPTGAARKRQRHTLQYRPTTATTPEAGRF